MKSFGATLAIIGLLLAGGLLAPGLYLSFRGLADPDGVVDGLVRISWLGPVLWLVGVWLHAERQGGRTKGLLRLEMPILLTLAVATCVLFGVLNDGKVIVAGTPRQLSLSEQKREARGEVVWHEARIPVVTGVAVWARQMLPPHPFPTLPASVELAPTESATE